MKIGTHSYDPRNCEQCGKEFMSRRDSIKRGMGRYCSKSCQVRAQHAAGTNKAARQRAAHHNWKNGRIINGYGYVMINVDFPHPRAYAGMYVPEHILVAEKILGRLLEKNEVVHHIDQNRQNNSPSNLSVMTRGRHIYIHTKGTLDDCAPLSTFLSSDVSPAEDPSKSHGQKTRTSELA